MCTSCVDVAADNWWALCSCAGNGMGARRGNVPLVSELRSDYTSACRVAQSTGRGNYEEGGMEGGREGWKEEGRVREGGMEGGGKGEGGVIVTSYFSLSEIVV